MRGVRSEPRISVRATDMAVISPSGDASFAARLEGLVADRQLQAKGCQLSRPGSIRAQARSVHAPIHPPGGPPVGIGPDIGRLADWQEMRSPGSRSNVQGTAGMWPHVSDAPKSRLQPPAFERLHGMSASFILFLPPCMHLLVHQIS